MSLLLTGGTVFSNGRFENKTVAIHQGRIVSDSLPTEGFSVIDQGLSQQHRRGADPRV